jgi:hypothetical protein
MDDMKQSRQLRMLLASVWILCLIGCSKSETVKPDDLSASTEEATANEPSVDGEVVVDTEANIQLGNVLYSYYSTIGTAMDIVYYSDETEGIVYTNLIDVTEDGIDELILIYKGNEYIENWEPYQQQNRFILEIWQATSEDRSAKLYYYEELESQVPLYDEGNPLHAYEVALVRLKDGNFTVKETVSFIDYPEHERFSYAFVSEEKETITFNVEGDEIFLNGHASSQEELDEQNATLTDEELVLIYTEDEQIVFALDGETATAVVSNTLATLYGSYLATFDKAKEVDGYTIQTELEYGNAIEHADIYSPEWLPSMFAYIMHYELADSDLLEDDGYYKVAEETVAAKFKEVYGYELTVGGLYLEPPNRSEPTEFAYEDGYFYAYPIDLYTPSIRRTVIQAYELADDAYYIVASHLEFSDYAYNIVSDQWVDSDEFLDEDPSSLDARIREWMKSGGIRYIIMSVKNGAPQFHYMSPYPLTAEEASVYVDLDD